MDEIKSYWYRWRSSRNRPFVYVVALIVLVVLYTFIFDCKACKSTLEFLATLNFQFPILVLIGLFTLGVTISRNRTDSLEAKLSHERFQALLLDPMPFNIEQRTYAEEQLRDGTSKLGKLYEKLFLEAQTKYSEAYKKVSCAESEV